jgi:Protein of unknown function (DUF2628)
LIGDHETAQQIVRQFGRLRRPPVAEPEALIADQLQQGVVPVDSTKTFVGPNGTYYDERWRWMEWRGLSRSWNWAAALSFGGWLAYRRFYGLAALYLGWLGLLLTLALEGASLRLIAVLHLLVAALVGAYGNTLYQQRFRRMSWKVAEGQEDHDARLKALAEAGGVDRRAVWIMAASGVGLGALLIGLEGWPAVDSY